jgi:predicted transcriptional regulator
MNSTDAQMENVTFRAPRDLITALETIAQDEDRDRSYIIRRVLREYTETKGKP